MKLFFFLMILSMSAFAQYRPYPNPYPYPGGYPGGYPYPYPFPGPHYPQPEDLCSKAEIEATTAVVIKACDAKMAEFSTEHNTSCKITKVSLSGCRAMCHQGELKYANLRMDTNSDCRKEKAYLRKTVINYY